MLGLGMGLGSNVAAGGGSPPPTNSAWNPLSTGTAPSSANYGFTNSDTTATYNATTGSEILARGTGKKTAGYFEVTPSFTGGNGFVGIADATLGLTNYVGETSTAIGMYSASGTIYNNGGSVGTGAVFGSDLIGVCVKASKFYISKGGVWLNSADPSAGTGGIDISAFLGSGLYPAVSTFNVGNSFTINTGATAFTYPLPTGVSAWG